MKTKLISHNSPYLQHEELEAATSVIRSGWLSQGPEVSHFEKEWCDFLGLPEDHAVAVSSGTAAVLLTLLSEEVGGKRVGIPAYLCASVRAAVSFSGAEVCLLDTDKDSPLVSSQGSEGLDYIIAPHTFGLPVNIAQFSDPEGRVIEDCAHSPGGMLNNKKLGTLGRYGIFSFYTTKVLTSGGQGGLIVSKDRQLIDRVRNLREYNSKDDSQLRLNLQMTEIQAAIGRVQLKKLPNFLERRDEIFSKYQKTGVELLGSTLGRPVRYRAIIRTKRPKQLIQHFVDLKIQAVVPWRVLYGATAPHATEFAESCVSIPLYPSLTNNEVDRVCEALSQIQAR